MDDYLEEIRNKGLETLEKFLLLLKEDMILFDNRRGKGIKPLTQEEMDLFFYPVDKSKANKELKGKEFTVSAEKYIKFEEKMSEIRQFSKSQYLASNAHFIYLFALFDQLILEISKICLKNDPKIMQNYKNYCLTYFESHKDKNLYKILPFEDKLIDYLSNLSNPLTVITKILEINFKKGLKQTEYYFNFIEMKERRNYLVHRSGISDEMFFKTIRKYLSKFPQTKVSDFISKLKKENKKNFDITLDYFLKTISTFYFLVSLIVNKAITINKTSNKKIPLFTDQFNDLLIFSLSEEIGQILLTVPIDLFPLYKSDYLDNNLSKMHDVDKVNWILCNTRFKEAFQLAYSNPSELTEEEKTTEKALQKLIEELDEKTNSLLKEFDDQLIKEIITSFLEKNYQKFTEKVFLYSKNQKVLLTDIESKWYMTRKLSEDNKFKKIFTNYKKKHNHEPNEITVVVPPIKIQE